MTKERQTEMCTLSFPIVAVIPSLACTYLTGGSGGTSHSWAVACVAVPVSPHRPRKREVQKLLDGSKFNLIRSKVPTTAALTVTNSKWKCEPMIEPCTRGAF